MMLTDNQKASCARDGFIAGLAGAPAVGAAQGRECLEAGERNHAEGTGGHRLGRMPGYSGPDSCPWAETLRWPAHRGRNPLCQPEAKQSAQGRDDAMPVRQWERSRGWIAVTRAARLFDPPDLTPYGEVLAHRIATLEADAMDKVDFYTGKGGTA